MVFTDIPLTLLRAVFLHVVDERTHQRVTDIDMADGVMFLCPKCYQLAGGSVGVHSVICWAPHVPLTHPPTPGRWRLSGTCLSDLSLVNGSSSVQLLGDGCKAHFWVRGGKAVDVT